MAQQLDVNNLAALAGEVLGDVTGLMSLFVFVVSLLLFFAIDAAWFPYRFDTTPASGAVGLSSSVKALLVDSDPGARWITPLIDGSAGDTPDEPALDPTRLEQTYR
jgi:hypothetical protein